jgi:DNA-binding CsgD family transcriptional regulator
MAITLPENHIIFSAEYDIQNICTKLLTQHGINNFNHVRIFDDDSCYVISNWMKIYRYLFETEQPIAAPVPLESVSKKFCYLIPEKGAYQKAMHDLKAFFNLAYPIDFFEQHDGYIDLFCFTSTPDNPEIINFYFNHMDVLEKFILYYKEKAANLIQSCEKQKIIIPKHMRANFNSHSGIVKNDSPTLFREKQAGKYYLDLTEKYKQIAFSKREIDCLNKLVMGYSAKETAKELGLSPRTIEAYLNNAKSKLGCHKKSDVIRKILNEQRMLF